MSEQDYGFPIAPKNYTAPTTEERTAFIENIQSEAGQVEASGGEGDVDVELSQSKEERDGIDLSEAQQRAADEVISILTSEHDKPQLIALVGFSGVGKSYVTQAISPVVEANKGISKDSEELGYIDSNIQAELKNKDVILRVLPRNLRLLRLDTREGLPEHELKMVRVVGMNQREIQSFIAKIDLSQSDLSAEQVEKYSLGLPQLALQLSTPGIDEAEAMKLMARYLAIGYSHSSRHYGLDEESLKEALKYLNVPLPISETELIELSKGDENGARDIYLNLPMVLEKRKELAEKGIIEESPLFVAPESQEIYDEALRKEYGYLISIFVPELDIEDIERIKQAFGYNEEYAPLFEMTDRKATRVRMFGAGGRKTSFYFKDLEKEPEYEDHEYFGGELEEDVRIFENNFLKGNYPIKPTDRGKGSFFISVNDHDNFVPALTGWMTETLLQQRGIPYIVENRAYGRDYAFDPKSNHITFIGESKR